MEPNQQYYFHMGTFIRMYTVDLTSKASAMFYGVIIYMKLL